MQNHELVEGLKRVKFEPWLDKIVEAAQERLDKGSEYVTECLRNKKEANIILDRTNEIKSVPIKNEKGVITGYEPIDPVAKDQWDHARKSYDDDCKTYRSNKLAICQIVKSSIDSYYTNKLHNEPDYKAKQDDLIWLITTLEKLCHGPTSTKTAPIVEIVMMQKQLIGLCQGDNMSNMDYKIAFNHVVEGLKSHKAQLGAVEGIMNEHNNSRSEEEAIEAYAATLFLINANKKYRDLRKQLHNGYAIKKPPKPIQKQLRKLFR